MSVFQCKIGNSFLSKINEKINVFVEVNIILVKLILFDNCCHQNLSDVLGINKKVEVADYL